MSTLRRLFRPALVPLVTLCLTMAGCDDSDSPDDSEQGEAYGSWGGGDEGPSADGPSCTNTCEYANDGDCDDGGPNSDFSLCAYGTDCGDCGPRDGGEPISSDDEDPVAQEWACEFTQHSRTACPGTPNSISESDRCVTVTAASASEAEAACSEYTSSDTDCYGSCCTRSYGTDRSVYEGSCY